MQFFEIIGHEKIKDDLQNMLKREKINHALLFSGPGGVGKLSLAEIFARAILCQEKNRPCEECSSCVQFKNRMNPDYIYVEPDNGSIKKEDIAKILDFFSIKPFNSKYKVAVVKNFDLATVEAQNAFLKTLEEPPEFAKIILTAENESALLPTILSRLKKYNFFPLKTEEVEKFLLENNYSDAESVSFIASYSNGSIEKAIALSSDEEFKKNRILFLDILEKAIEKDTEYVLKNINIFEKQEDIDEVIELYLSWIRDLMAYKAGLGLKKIHNKDLIEKLRKQSRFGVEFILKIKEQLIKLKMAIDSNVNKMFAIEMFFIEIMEESFWK